MKMKFIEYERNAFIEALRSYLGVPWRHAGRGRTGVDCVGLLACAGADAGLPEAAALPPATYGRGYDGAALIAAIRRHAVPVTAPEPGDIVRLAGPTHVGAVVPRAGGGYNVIHAPQGGRVVEVRLNVYRQIFRLRRWHN